MSTKILTLGALAIGLTSIAGADTKKIDPTKMTCAEFVALETGVKPEVIAYLEGYSEGGKGRHPAVVAVPAVAEVTYVERVCAETPKESVWQKIRSKLPGGEKKASDPTKMTCEEYVALDKEIQPQVANWLQGYTEAGKSEKSGTAGAGAIEPVVLERDVVSVVAECGEAPKKSLWDKIKEKF